MNIFSFFRIFRGENEEPLKGERQSRESQERPRGFFLDNDRSYGQNGRPAPRQDMRSRRVSPGADNQRVLSFSRSDEAADDGRSAESRERPGAYYPGQDRSARTLGRTERPPVSTGAPTGRYAPAAEPQRFARGAEPARSFNESAQSLLEDLKSVDPGIIIVFITSNEGRLAEHTMASYTEKVRIGASSAISLAVARKESKDLQLGDARELQIRGEKGSILLFSLGARGVLTIVADQSADTDRILHESYQVANRLMPVR
jgi:predicted regulator of Ras-like GTPase activity (Roadblock/LC7/MglB family)